MTEEEWKQVDGYQSLQKQGFGGVGAVILDSCLKGDAKEITYLALMLRQCCYRWSPEDRRTLEELSLPMQRAVRRMSFSLLQRETILTQLADEQNLALIVLDTQGRIREANRRAWVWSLDFFRNQEHPSEEVLSSFVRALLEQPRKGGANRRTFSYSRQTRELEIWEHVIDPSIHALPEPYTLLILRRTQEASGSWRTLSQQLSARCLEVAEALAAPGATAQTIAVALGISHRTVESHISTIYKTIGVQNRTQFVALIRGY